MCERCGFCDADEFWEIIFRAPVIANGVVVGHVRTYRHKVCREYVMVPVR